MQTLIQQTTIQRPVECSGIGLHGGGNVRLKLRPASADSGILVSGGNGAGYCRVRPESAQGTTLATTLACNGQTLATVEHLLAAVRGLGIDNLRIEVLGGEAPIMDGSAAPFVYLLRSAGIRKLDAPRKVLRLTRPISVEDGGRSVTAKPYHGFRVDYHIDFAHPLIGAQSLSFDLTPEAFARGIAKARTFGFLKDVEMLQRNGMALGGSLDNAVVLDDYSLVNPGGLRFGDEFVRHKILDFIGDMALMELPVFARFTVHCAGHALHNRFLRELSARRQTHLEEMVLAPAADGAERAKEMPGEPVAAPAPA